MRRLVLSFAMAAAILGTATARAQEAPPPRPVEAFVDSASAKWSAGDKDGAAAEAEAAVAAHPDSAAAWSLRGWMRIETRRLDEAEADLSKALELDPKFALAMSRRGMLQLTRKDRAGAIEWFDRALQANPRDQIALRERGRIRIQTKNLAGARKDLELGVKVAPADEHMWVVLGWLDEQQAEWADAASRYTKAIRLGIDDGWTYAARARALAELGHLDAVIEDVRRAAKRAPKEHEFNLAAVRTATETARRTGAEPGIPVRGYLAQAEFIRDLEAKATVPCALVSRNDAGNRVAPPKEGRAAAKSEASSAGLRRLGLLRSKTQSAADARAQVKRQQIAGYYDPSTKELCVVGSSPDDLADESVIIHELTHALQDQHFGIPAFRLRSMARAPAGVTDEDLELTTLSVVEGDATLVQTIWQLCNQMEAQPSAAMRQIGLATAFTSNGDPVQITAMALRQSKGSGAAAAEQVQKLDPYAVITEVAPYLLGSAYVENVRSRGGWEAVAALYENPPRTMEQILHPAKPGVPRDEPTPVPLVELAPPEGWTLTDVRVLGELNAAILVRTHGAKWNAARTAAKGWDGDLLLAFRTEAGADAIIWATTWDTPADAAKFATAHAAVIPSKDPGAGPRSTRTLGGGGGGGGDDGAVVSWVCGSDTGGTGRTILRGREFFVVEGFSEDEAAALEATLLAAPIPHVD